MKNIMIYFEKIKGQYIWFVLTVLFVGIISSLMWTHSIQAGVSGDGNFTISPESSGTDDVVANADSNWTFAVTTTAQIVDGDVIKFILPTMSAGDDFSFGTVTTTALSGITFYSSLGAALSNVLSNPSFESDLTSWDTNGATGDYSITVTTTAYDGTKAIQAYGASGAGNSASVAQTYSSLVADSSYTLSFYARGLVGGETLTIFPQGGASGCAEGSFNLYNFSTETWECIALPAGITSDHLYTDTVTANYARYSFTVASPPGATQFTTSLVAKDGNTILYDAIQLENAVSTTTFNTGGTSDDVEGIGSNGLVAYGFVSSTIATSTSFSITIGGVTNGSSTLANVTDLDWQVIAGTPASSDEPWSTLSSTKFSLTAAQSLSIPVPTAPTDITTSTVSATSISFGWTDASDDETGFVVQQSTDGSTFSTVTTTSANIESATSTDLTPNTGYYFRIAAINSYGYSSYVTSSEWYTDAAVPASVSGSSSGQTSIALTWGANSNPSGTVYEVYNVTSGTTVATTTDTSYSVTGLTAGTSYQFKVRAQNLGDTSTSLWSDTSSLITTESSTETNNSGGGTGVPVTVAPIAPSVSAPTNVSISISPNTPTVVAVGNTSHTVTLNSVSGNGDITLTIQSDPVTIMLSSGQEELIDTNSDGEKDLFIRYDGQSGGEINLIISAIDDLEFSINHALSQTDSRNVVLYFNSPQTDLVAISNSLDFSEVSFEPYETTKSWLLTPGIGQKTVYAKLRSAQGGTRVVSDTIMLADSKTCPVAIEKSYKAKAYPGVYYVTNDCTKRPFVNEQKFFSYFDSWDDV